MMRRRNTTTACSRGAIPAAHVLCTSRFPASASLKVPLQPPTPATPGPCQPGPTFMAGRAKGQSIGNAHKSGAAHDVAQCGGNEVLGDEGACRCSSRSSSACVTSTTWKPRTSSLAAAAGLPQASESAKARPSAATVACGSTAAQPAAHQQRCCCPAPWRGGSDTCWPLQEWKCM